MLCKVSAQNPLGGRASPTGDAPPSSDEYATIAVKYDPSQLGCTLSDVIVNGCLGASMNPEYPNARPIGITVAPLSSATSWCSRSMRVWYWWSSLDVQRLLAAAVSADEDAP